MEWTVVTVLIAIVGLVAVLVKPMLSLDTTMTKLVVAVDVLNDKMKDFTDRNSESHERLFKKQEEQENRLDDHEGRISNLEHGRET